MQFPKNINNIDLQWQANATQFAKSSSKPEVAVGQKIKKISNIFQSLVKDRASSQEALDKTKKKSKIVDKNVAADVLQKGPKLDQKTSLIAENTGVVSKNTKVKEHEDEVRERKTNLETYYLAEHALIQDLMEKKQSASPQEKILLDKDIARVQQTPLAMSSAWEVVLGKESAKVFLEQIPLQVKALSGVDPKFFNKTDRELISKLTKNQGGQLSLENVAKTLNISQRDAVKVLLRCQSESIKINGPHVEQFKTLEAERGSAVLHKLGIDETTKNEKVSDSLSGKSKKLVITLRNETTGSTQFVDVNSFVDKKDFDEVLGAYRSLFNNINSYEFAKSGTNSKDAIQLIRDANKVLCDNLLLKAEKEGKTNELNGIKTIYTVIEKCLLQAEESLVQKKVKKHPKIDDLYKLREPDRNKELVRLMQNPRITKSLDVWKKHLNDLPFVSWRDDKDQYTKHLVAYGQSLEIQESLKDEYYIVNHCQPTDVMFVNILAREFKAIYEQNHTNNFHVLRHNAFLEGLPQERDVKWYKENMRCDTNYKTELLSGDVFLESIQSGESALDFFTNVSDVGEKLTQMLTDKILEYYIPNENTRAKFFEKFDKLIKNRPEESANIYSICVPKDKMEGVSYFSKGYGVFVTPLNDQELVKVQSGQSGTTKQIRLLTNKLNSQEGVHVLLNSTLEHQEILKIEGDVRLLIQQALTQFLIEEKPK